MTGLLSGSRRSAHVPQELLEARILRPVEDLGRRAQLHDGPLGSPRRIVDRVPPPESPIEDGDLRVPLGHVLPVQVDDAFRHDRTPFWVSTLSARAAGTP